MPVVTRSMIKKGLLIGIDPEDRQWQELPPEMLEKILERVSNKADLLTCRLINSTWKANVTAVIQKRLLDTLTKWESFKFIATLSPNGFASAFPRVEIIQPSLDQELIVIIPKSGVNLDSTEANPIITKSLCLYGPGSTVDDRFSLQELIPASKIFETHGSTLTSLCFANMKLAPKEATKILRHLDNLVTLNLDNLGGFLLPQEYMDPKWESFLPKLLHLSCSCNTNDRIGSWVFKHVASQLVSLNFDQHRQALPSNDKEPLVLKKLKELRIRRSSKRLMVNVLQVKAPILERLSVDLDTNTNISFWEFLGFIINFSSTLIELQLKNTFDVGSLINELQLGASNKGSGVKFPKMMTFSYGYDGRNINSICSSPRSPDFWQYFKTFFLSRFPNLKVLNLVFTGDYGMEFLTKEEVLEIYQRNGVWNLCPQLKTVKIMHSIPAERTSVCIRVTKGEMEQQ